MPTDDDKPAKIGIRADDGTVETPWAFDLGGNRYRLDNIPFFAYRISAHDVVEAVPDADGLPMFQRVVEKSGNRTVRVWLPESADVAPGPSLLADIKRLGCTYGGAYNKLICINVPPSVPLEVIAHRLTELGVEWEYADPTHDDPFPDEDGNNGDARPATG